MRVGGKAQLLLAALPEGIHLLWCIHYTDVNLEEQMQKELGEILQYHRRAPAQLEDPPQRDGCLQKKATQGQQSVPRHPCGRARACEGEARGDTTGAPRLVLLNLAPKPGLSPVPEAGGCGCGEDREAAAREVAKGQAKVSCRNSQPGQGLLCCPHQRCTHCTPARRSARAGVSAAPAPQSQSRSGSPSTWL